MTRHETRDELSNEDAAPARQRIAKLMARVGLCSRRDAEAWIVDGRVSVNGEVLTSPAIDVGPTDSILVDGAPLPRAERTRLFLFHKPRGLVTSDRDPEGRATVADYLREHWPDGPRVVTIGRLDINTEGLLLLTNDGGLARILELPKTGWVRRYRVRAKGETDQGVLDGLAGGLTIEGVDYAGIEAKLDRQQGANVWLTMGLREGKNREVKRVLEHVGLEVNRLIRLSFGPFQLGDLPEGAVEEVRTRVLRDQLGPALAAAAAVTFEDAAPQADGRPTRGDRRPERSAASERVDRSVRAPTPPRRDERGPRAERGRGGDRPLRRSHDSDAPPPIRERPAGGTRKHVSALRAEESEAARRGPRRRIERGDLTDRRDRKVAVERLVGPQAIEPTRARVGGRPARSEDSEAPGRTGRRQASPSALAKRARVARSGGRPDDARETTGGRRDDGATARVRERPTEGERSRPARGAADNPRRRRPDGQGGHGERRAEPAGREARRGTGSDGKRAQRPDDRVSRPPRRDSRRPRSDAPGRAPTTSEARPARPKSARPERSERPGRGERPARDARSAQGEGRGPRANGTKFEGKRSGRPRAARDEGRADGHRRGGAPSGRPGGKPRGPGRGKPRPKA